MKEYKEKSIEELRKIIADKRNSMRDFRFGSTGSKIKNVKLGRTLKKDVARVMTELTLRAKASKNK